MNLMHLLAKKDPNLELQGEVGQVKLRVNGHIYTGLSLPPGGRITLKTVFRWYPFNTRPYSPDWLVQTADRQAAADESSCLSISFQRPDGDVVAECENRAGPSPSPVRLPAIHDALDQAALEALDLVVSNSASADRRLLLFVTETVPTEPLYAQARGIGVELGPGPYPRLFSNADRTVFYVEREPVEQWRQKYSFRGTLNSLDSQESEALWRQYTVGLAHDLPFDDASLDFIFSADVLEHLVNPIGHLEYWRQKLKPGGKIVKIIPYIAGCGDYRNRPTALSWWLEEYRKGRFKETLEHHEPYASARGMDAHALMAKAMSSHFSFFNRENLTQLLEYAVDGLGFSGFNIHHAPNGKKIHFILFS
ncbi:MAG TPA: class I SAM-dependent methyltransferase [Caulobacteraceae bacterium]